ncbi:unnamed protein product [Nippostrongylus brasiliensis]|uniref:Rab3 GTPase-activating protein catalytic subunit n=1 Tax=Nippostrongylus brasiliensis TaxID=27835 RepID=A0A0N4YTF1_NIPBR|nr:unnamed protein product [Nippostrongylus brasiliensis]
MFISSCFRQERHPGECGDALCSVAVENKELLGEVLAIGLGSSSGSSQLRADCFDSSDPHRSEDEIEATSPSTSTFKPPTVPCYIDGFLQEILLSSPAHLFSCGLLPADKLSASWERWLCHLACSLTPNQWQGYWAAHTAVFGLGALPVHLCSFFNRSMLRDYEEIDRQQLEYEEVKSVIRSPLYRHVDRSHVDLSMADTLNKIFLLSRKNRAEEKMGWWKVCCSY